MAPIPHNLQSTITDWCCECVFGAANQARLLRLGLQKSQHQPCLPMEPPWLAGMHRIGKEGGSWLHKGNLGLDLTTCWFSIKYSVSPLRKLCFSACEHEKIPMLGRASPSNRGNDSSADIQRILLPLTLRHGIGKKGTNERTADGE